MPAQGNTYSWYLLLCKVQGVGLWSSHCSVISCTSTWAILQVISGRMSLQAHWVEELGLQPALHSSLHGSTDLHLSTQPVMCHHADFTLCCASHTGARMC